MSIPFNHLLHTRYPQNYILRNPYKGALIITLFCFLFILLYHPLDAQKAQPLTFEQTMAIYCLVAGLSVLLELKILKLIPYFSEEEDWTILKELLAVILILFGLGISVYFLAFLIEPPADRWNFATLLDSCIRVFLLGILPFSFFSLMNYRHLLRHKQPNEMPSPDGIESEITSQLIQIDSKLKKDHLSFLPDQFLYAESEGNYVTFHLQMDQEIGRKMIRNSISNIEQQLSAIPHFIRTHRAFIVNLKKVKKKQGNASGYRLHLEGTDTEVPVSRQKTVTFDEIWEKIPR